jgi:hypothetical protein
MAFLLRVSAFLAIFREVIDKGKVIAFNDITDLE